MRIHGKKKARWRKEKIRNEISFKEERDEGRSESNLSVPLGM